MPLSADTVVAIIGLFLAVPPVVFAIWQVSRQQPQSQQQPLLPLYQIPWLIPSLPFSRMLERSWLSVCL